MTRPLHLTPLLALLAIAGIAHAQEQPLPDARAFLNQSLARIRSNDLVRSLYTFTEVETRYSYDSSGRVVRKQARIYEVLPSPESELTYRRLVSVNGAAPGDMAKRDAEQTRKEQAWDASRRREGEDARAARLRKAAEEDRREQAVVNELTAIYEMRMTGRQVIEGRPAIGYTFDPRRGYVARTPEGRIINHFRGKAWIDEQDRELVRMEVEVLQTVSVALGFIVRLAKGSRGRMERRKLDGESWLPTYTRFTGSGSVFFIWRVDLDQATEFVSYRKKPLGD